MKTWAGLLLISCSAFGQINLKDSTVEVIAYWKKGEHRTYEVTNNRLITKGKDTLVNDRNGYLVDITVLDLTPAGYTLRWHYYSLKTNSKDPVTRRMADLSENSNVIVKTDKYGTYQGVENWEEVRDRMFKRIDSLTREFHSLPNIKEIMALEKEKISTRFGIDQTVMRDATQYYFFFGRRLILGKPYSDTRWGTVPWLKKEIETRGTIAFEQLNAEEGLYQFSFTLEMNQDQLSEAAYEYDMKSSDKAKLPTPKPEDYSRAANKSVTVTKLFRSGWVSGCSRTMIVTNETNHSFEELTLRLRN